MNIAQQLVSCDQHQGPDISSKPFLCDNLCIASLFDDLKTYMKIMSSRKFGVKTMLSCRCSLTALTNVKPWCIGKKHEHGSTPIINRRKFRSQTSDNMDRWKAEQGRGREKRKIRRKKSRRERVRRKQMREKVGKSRNTVFFQWFVAPEGRKVGSLKRRVRSQPARWEMKNCTPLWREAHLQVKMHKTHQLRTTFTSWDVEKVHAVVARSTFQCQSVKNIRGSDHFWKLRCRKSARRCGAKHISKSKC